MSRYRSQMPSTAAPTLKPDSNIAPHLFKVHDGNSDVTVTGTVNQGSRGAFDVKGDINYKNGRHVHVEGQIDGQHGQNGQGDEYKRAHGHGTVTEGRTTRNLTDKEAAAAVVDVARCQEQRLHVGTHQDPHTGRKDLSAMGGTYHRGRGMTPGGGPS